VTAELRVGGHARVVARGDGHEGQIGVIDAIFVDGDGADVLLLFDGDLDPHGFERAEVEAVSAQAPVRHSDAPEMHSRSPDSRVRAGRLRRVKPLTGAKGPPPDSATGVKRPSLRRRTEGDADGEYRIRISARAVLLTGAALAVIAAVVVIFVVALRPDHTSDFSATADPTQSFPGRPVTGTFDDWQSAVCAPGKYFSGSRYPGTVAGGRCIGTNAGYDRLDRTRADIVYTTEWPSEYDLRNAMARFQMTFYVEVTHDGNPTAFSINQSGDGPAALEPLDQFGLDITKVPG
jgi:hypothetical protein